MPKIEVLGQTTIKLFEEGAREEGSGEWGVGSGEWEEEEGCGKG